MFLYAFDAHQAAELLPGDGSEIRVEAVETPALMWREDASSRDAEADASPIPQDRILGYLPMVESIARRVFGSLPPNARLELHDLAQSGLVGLVRAGRCYNPATTVPFSIYARYRIEGEILDSLRRYDLAPRRLRRWQKQVSAARQELAANLHRDPTEEELCDHLMISLGEMRSRSLALIQARPPEPTFIEDRQHADPTSGPEDLCEQQQLREVIERLIDGLSPRYQQVIRSHYGHHMTLKEIGAEMGVHESRVSQMHRSALEDMGRILKKYGICSPAHL